MNKRKERKRIEAEARQAKYAKLTRKERLELARGRRGHSFKEIQRISEAILRSFEEDEDARAIAR